MTTTWADVLSEVRIDLKDSGTTSQRWTDAELYLFLKDAVRDYSYWYPLRQDKVELTEDTNRWTLPSDFVDDIYVQCPENRFLEKRRPTPGRRYREISRPLYYFIEGGYLYLMGSPTSDDSVYLTYYATHTLPADETDNAFVFTVPDLDIELIRLYVEARAYKQLRSKQSNLDRFKRGGGRRDDNPVEPEVENLMDEYHWKIAERYSPGAVMLFRPGRTR